MDDRVTAAGASAPGQREEAVRGEEAAAGRRGLIFSALAGFHVFKRDLQAHPVWSVLLAACLFVLAFLATEVLGYFKGLLLGPDEFLVQISDAQKKEFSALHDGLRKISASIDSGDRAAFKGVTEAVKVVERTNQDLIQQLALARQENENMRKLSEQKGGVSGGYDFILSSSQGLRVDSSTMVGLRAISGRQALLTITSADRADSFGTTVAVGEAVNYVAADGRVCKLGVLSVNNTGTGSASFAIACSLTA